VGRSDRHDPFFKGLRFAPASDVATIADRSVAHIDLGQSGGLAGQRDYLVKNANGVPQPYPREQRRNVGPHELCKVCLAGLKFKRRVRRIRTECPDPLDICQARVATGDPRS
jgi:hypothetical protein